MQEEIDALHCKSESKKSENDDTGLNINIDKLYTRLCHSLDKGTIIKGDQREVEEFWREMGQSEGSNRFGIIARYFGKGLIP